MGQSAENDAPLVVGRAAVHVPYGPQHVTADEADADYLRSAARNIAWSRCLGSNLTNTVTALLNGLAEQLEVRHLTAAGGESDG